MHSKLAWILLTSTLTAGGGLAGVACSSGPRAVRGSDEPGLDYHAMSTGLDKRDLQRMMNENMHAMRNSAVVQRWTGANRPGVAASIFLRAPARQPALPQESALLISQWQSPTDFLLATPGQQWLQSVPQLGESLTESVVSVAD